MGDKAGSLFTGVGGPDMAVAEVFGTELAWTCDNDPAAGKVIAHRMAAVPNLGDITRVGLSYSDEEWQAMSDRAETDPDYAMPEPDWSVVPAVDSARDVWATDHTDLFSGLSDVYSEIWLTSGMTRSGVAYPLPPWAPPMSGSGSSSSPSTLLPTPRATDGTKGGPNQRGSSGDLMLPSAAAKLLPTPQAHDGRNTSPVLPSQDTAALRVSQGKSNLEDSIALLGTPRCSDGIQHNLRTGVTNPRGRLEDQIAMLPTPTARDWKGANQRRDATCLPGALLPTPTATDARSSSGSNPAWGHGTTLTDAARSIGASTPPPSDDGSGSSDGQLPFPEWTDPEVA